MTLGTEILLLDDVAASLRAMAAHAVVYDDAVLLWLADQVERVADRSQQLADAEAAIALLTGTRPERPRHTTIAMVPAGWRSGRTHRS